MEFLGILFGFARQQKSGDCNFETIVILKGMLGIESMKEDHGRRRGDAGKLETLGGLFNEATSLDARQSFLLHRHALFERR